MCIAVSVVFFFQAEDGIRDIGVTGVQTCALPICEGHVEGVDGPEPGAHRLDRGSAVEGPGLVQRARPEVVEVRRVVLTRSEERRVGKECRSRWSPYH